MSISECLDGVTTTNFLLCHSVKYDVYGRWKFNPWHKNSLQLQYNTVVYKYYTCLLVLNHTVIMGDCAKTFWTVVWFISLLCICWPLGFVCAIIYVLLQPFFPCCSGCNDFRDLLLKGTQLPQTASVNMMNGKSMC